jgi:hypothetical protein
LAILDASARWIYAHTLKMRAGVESTPELQEQG